MYIAQYSPVKLPTGLRWRSLHIPDTVNAFGGLADAWFDGIPLLGISGNVPTNEQRGYSGVRQNGFQEMEIVSMTKHITKYSVSPNSAESFPDIVSRAYNLATTGRKGGAHQMIQFSVIILV